MRHRRFSVLIGHEYLSLDEMIARTYLHRLVLDDVWGGLLRSKQASTTHF